MQSAFSNVTFKHVLLPIWIAAYRYKGKPYQFLVNGQTGEVVGHAPYSVWKILLLILALAAVVTAIILLRSQPHRAAGASQVPLAAHLDQGSRVAAPPTRPSSSKR